MDARVSGQRQRVEDNTYRNRRLNERMGRRPIQAKQEAAIAIRIGSLSYQRAFAPKAARTKA